MYATVWTSAAIQVYFWPRNEIPGDVSAGAPDPSTWGTPLADFEQANDGCNIDQNWLAQTIVSLRLERREMRCILTDCL